jgi:hypothetical protein
LYSTASGIRVAISSHFHQATIYLSKILKDGTASKKDATVSSHHTYSSPRNSRVAPSGLAFSRSSEPSLS